MGVDCGSQVLLCEYPIRFDTYKGCSHGCRYCFAQTKINLDDIQVRNCDKALGDFIRGKRHSTVNWCDWEIPLHWGGLSDPFQPAERECGSSLKCLKILRDTQYPVIISTKGSLIAEEPYLSLIGQCNAVVQISMVCSSYDKMEPGAPTFEERLEMVKKLSKVAKRVIVRAQPYIIDILDEFLRNIPRIAEAGAYGVTVEGMKFKRKKPGLVRVRGDLCYPDGTLRSHYAAIKGACHANGMAFYCAENRLRKMGDSTACCGCGDLEGFEGNPYNIVSIANGSKADPTPAMVKKGTAMCFKALHQTTAASSALRNRSFAEQMQIEANNFKI